MERESPSEQNRLLDPNRNDDCLSRCSLCFRQHLGFSQKPIGVLITESTKFQNRERESDLGGNKSRKMREGEVFYCFIWPLELLKSNFVIIEVFFFLG